MQNTSFSTNVFFRLQIGKAGTLKKSESFFEEDKCRTPRRVDDRVKVGTILTGVIEISVCKAILCTRSEDGVQIRRRSRFHILTRRRI